MRHLSGCGGIWFWKVFVPVVGYFLLKKLRQHRKKKEKVHGIPIICFSESVDMKTAPALRASLVLLSCEEQTISVLFTELRFVRGPDLSSLMWSLTLHYPLQEIMQSLCILCLLMEKMMNEQKRSGLIVCYWIFNWTGYILGNDNLYTYASVIGVIGRYVRLGLILLST